MRAGKVVHFEIPIDEPARAVAFYRDALGWPLEQWGPMEYWTTTGGSGDGIGGGLTRRSTDAPVVTFYISVDDIDDALDSIEAAGGRRLTERMPIPTMGWSALFEDTEGNRIGLFQHDPAVQMTQ